MKEKYTLINTIENLNDVACNDNLYFEIGSIGTVLMKQKKTVADVLFEG